MKRHEPGWQHVTPEPDSPGWKRVIARGCGLYHDEMNGDYDCTHGYTWSCEGCPIGMEAQGRAEEQWEIEHQGPPRPPSMRDGFVIWCADVGAEL